MLTVTPTAKSVEVISRRKFPLSPVQQARSPGSSMPGSGLPLFLQPKLAISQPGDPSEIEADRVADQVMRMSVPTVQRQCAVCEEEEAVMVSRKAEGTVAGEAPRSIHSTLRSPGQPLAASARAFFEPRFGQDLSQVRVHTDPEAQQSAREVSALAYTVGSHVVFDAGRYAPGTPDGQRLLAHELTHVMQQSGTGVSVPIVSRKQTDWPAWHQDILRDVINMVGATADLGEAAQWRWFLRYLCGLSPERAQSLHARWNRSALAVPGNKDDFPLFILANFGAHYDEALALLEEIGTGPKPGSCALPQPDPEPPPPPKKDPAPSSPPSGGGGGCDVARLDAIEREARSIIADARTDGHQVAADNLEHYLGNTGKTRELQVTWLRDFSAVVSAETENRHRFEDQLSDKADGMPVGEGTLADYWDKVVSPFKTTELFYASGDSTLKSSGTFTLKRDATDHVVIEGMVIHDWYDRYDWNPGASTYIPGHGFVSDDDMFLLAQCGRAKNFDLKAAWKQSLTSSIQVNDYWPNFESWLWGAPRSSSVK